ncbi:MAG: ABC transporter permease subunit, partial [Acidobacteriota bacterium]
MSRLPPMDEAWIAQLLSNGWTTFMLIIVSVWVGSGLVARDRKEQTLEVFLGRAIGPAQYLWAKAAALGVFLVGFTFVPTVIVVTFQVGLTGDVPFLWQHARILWGTLLYALLGIGSLVLFVLALSSLSRSPRIVGLALIGILFFGPAVSGILWAITHKSLVWYFSPIVELKALAFMCLGVHSKGPLGHLGDFHVAVFFLLMVIVSLAVLALRFYRRGVLR